MAGGITTKSGAGTSPAPDPRIESSLNGGGQQIRVASRVSLDELQPYDVIAGTVMERSVSTLTVAVVAGSLIRGEEPETGSWWRIAEVHRVTVVEKFLRQVDPKPGMFVTLRYRGRGRDVNGRARAQLFDVGWIEPGASAQAEVEVPAWAQ
jgi:hypothetical protein